MLRPKQICFSEEGTAKEISTSTVLAPVKMPAGLSHIDSDFCWCEPLVIVNENEEEVVIHREVTWN